MAIAIAEDANNRLYVWIQLPTIGSRTHAPGEEEIRRGHCLQAYIGPPGVSARYEILCSCISELQRVQVIPPMDAPPLPWDALKPSLNERKNRSQPPDKEQEEEMSIDAATPASDPVICAAEQIYSCSEMLR